MSGRSLTFYSLFNQVDSVEIPILQRDYAQGRSEEEEVRTLFLRSLFNALNQQDGPVRQPLDLDFVYGNYENSESKVFSVLDGQQRLTTLFLLHWYLAAANGRLEDFRAQFVSKDGQSRFTYKTRPSTTEFFNALVVSDFVKGDITNSKKIFFSKQIIDCQWFYLSWKQDPTVQACLCMLDAIQDMFADRENDLFEKLLVIDKPFITFQFLDLHSFGLSDELYIKMNARGKPLTVFENFKAKLEQFIESCAEPWPEYRLSFREGKVNGYDYFIHKIDTDWADLFWPYRNVCSDDNTFDDEFMNFFRLIIMYQCLLNNRASTDFLTQATDALLGDQGRLKEPSLSKYEELNCFNQNLIIRFIQIIDLICDKGLKNNKIRLYMAETYYYAEEETFKRIISNGASYDDKLRFFAFYSYLVKGEDLGELKNWIRVIYNLVENTVTDSASKFYQALFVIDELSKIDLPILDALEADCKVPAFLQAQVLEEKIKAHLILKSDEWHEVIIKAEKHHFFNGQIGCILNFAGILDFYRKYKHCDWEDTFNKQYFERFNRYFHSLSYVFNVIGKSSSSIGYAWERAVLSKGVYCTSATWDRLNLLSSRSTKSNIPRDHSWRRVLRIGDEAVEKKQTYVKAVLDDPLFTTNNLAVSLQAICDEALHNTELDAWRHELIKHKELFDCCEQGFISHNASETILLGKSQRNHYHCEFFTKALELELQASKNLLFPFTLINYEAVKSREEDAGIVIKGLVFDKKDYLIEIKRPAANFTLYFKDVSQAECPDKLKYILENHGFNWGGDSSVFHNGQMNMQQVKNKLFNLCDALKGLQDE